MNDKTVWWSGRSVRLVGHVGPEEDQGAEEGGEVGHLAGLAFGRAARPTGIAGLLGGLARRGGRAVPVGVGDADPSGVGAAAVAILAHPAVVVALALGAAVADDRALAAAARPVRSAAASALGVEQVPSMRAVQERGSKVRKAPWMDTKSRSLRLFMARRVLRVRLC